MLKRIILLIAFPGSAVFAQEGVLKIQVTDSAKSEPLELANVLVENRGNKAGAGMTDSKGNVTIKNLAPGVYTIKTGYTGYAKKEIKGVVVKNTETTYLNVRLSQEGNMLGVVEVMDYRVPLINPQISDKPTFTAIDLQNSAYRDPAEILSSVEGAVEMPGNSTPVFRGNRPDGVMYVIDGVPVVGSHGIPFGAIQQMSVTLGGLPAKYGDATGAVIEIETKSGLVNPNP